MTLCECGHNKTQHNKKYGCTYQYDPKSTHDYQDSRGFCICTEFYRIDFRLSDFTQKELLRICDLANRRLKENLNEYSRSDQNIYKKIQALKNEGG